jgi:hypothetical protein
MRKLTATACLAVLLLGCDYTFHEDVTYEGRTTEEWVKLTQDDDMDTRLKAIEMLGQIGPIEASQSVPALARSVSDVEPRVRLEALRQLETLAPKAKKAEHAVTRAMNDKNKIVAKQAMKTFKAITLAQPSALNGN